MIFEVMKIKLKLMFGKLCILHFITFFILLIFSFFFKLIQIMWRTACSLGFLLHYIMPQLRKQLPWLCIARPVLRSLEHEQFEAQAPAAVTWFEKVKT